MAGIEPWLESRILGRIEADELTVGKGVFVAPNVLITGKDGPARRVHLGDFSFIGENTKVLCPEFVLGDYTKLHANAFCHGEAALRIGSNCWFGGNVILDSMGGLDIEDNVGVGAHSQLWTHMQFGDIVEGCRFHSRRYMRIGEDVWFVGHCIVSPVRVEPRSMALVGSVVTSTMARNRIYAGVPARDVSEKMGGQFADRTPAEKAAKLQELLEAFLLRHPNFKGQLRIVQSHQEIQPGICNMNVADRTYNQTYSEAEVAFFKTHVPLVKFRAAGKSPYVPQEGA